jgi:hypothetical protein
MTGEVISSTPSLACFAAQRVTALFYLDKGHLKMRLCLAKG